MRNCLKTIISISAVVSVLGLNSSVFGVAAFARQTGLDCTSCHASVGFPTLNTFGQAFKAGGFINGDDASMMGDGEALSIPKNLNGSIVFKARASYISKEAKDPANPTKSKTTTTDELDFPDEWAFLFGGRVAKNAGFLVEYSGSALSFKLPIVFDLAGGKLGVVPFWTDGLGVGYGFENLSTGAVRNIRAVEERGIASAVSYVEGKLGGNGKCDDGTGALVACGNTNGLAGGASGVTAYYWMGIGHVAVTGYLPASSEQVGPGIEKPNYAQYIRAAVTPSVAGFDLAVGVQKSLGTSSAVGADLGTMNYLGVDAQVMGTLGLPVAFFVTYGQADNKTNAADKAIATDALGLGGPTVVTEASAITFLADVQLIENKLNLAAGMRLGSYTDSSVVYTSATASTETAGDTITDNALLLEVKYNLARNLRLSADYSMALNIDDFATTGAGKTEGPSSKTSKARVMLFGSF